VVSEDWKPLRKQLQGTSNVVADDPYEMRIICPKNHQTMEVKVSDKYAVVSGIVREDGLVRVTVIPSVTGSMDWHVSFKKAK